MNAEQKILEAYRASDTRGKLSILEYAMSMAEDWPELTSADDAIELAAGNLEDFESPTIIGPPIKI